MCEQLLGQGVSVWFIEVAFSVFVFRLRDRGEDADGIPLVMRDTISFLQEKGMNLLKLFMS